MMHRNNTKIIFGPPGTGKTTALTDVFDVIRRGGTHTSKVAFLAYTRKAAIEAKSRVMTKYCLPSSSLPWFRTLHSFAYQSLELSREDVMTDGDYIELANLLGLYITTRNTNGSGDGATLGDRLLSMEQRSRAMRVTLRQCWVKSVLEYGVSWDEIERFQVTYHKFKTVRKKIDFVDMLQIYLQQGPIPDIHTLIVDEAQDLSQLQWDVVHKIATNAKSIYIAGDDDQSIYRWAGADPAAMMEIPGEKSVLAQSYRVPASIQKVASDIITKIKVRQPKQWAPRDDTGEVRIRSNLDKLDLSSGTHLMLARNQISLVPFTEHCKREGYLYSADVAGKRAVRPSVIRAIGTWQTLRKGDAVPMLDAVNLYAHMGAKKGFAYGSASALKAEDEANLIDIEKLTRKFGLLHGKRTLWRDVIENVTDDELLYLDQCLLRRPECATEGVRIRIGTIHSVKGGEADHVTLITDLTKKSYDAEKISPDDEARVWYVAVTRAIKTLTIILPQTQYAYRLPV